MNIINWWQTRAQREKIVLAGGAVVLFIIIIYLLLEPAIQERRRLAAGIPQLREDLAWMQAHVDDVRQWRIPETSAQTGHSLTPALVQEALKNAGLQDQVTDLRPADNQGVAVTFDAVVYADLMTFLHKIRQASGARTDKARFRRLDDKPGVVSASLVLSPGDDR